MSVTYWSRTGVWKHVFEILATDADNEYAIIDATIARAHQHRDGAKKTLEKNDQVVISSQKNHTNPRPYDKYLYKKRHLIENFFAKLKQYRAIATRYDKTDQSFLGVLDIIASIIWIH